MPYQEVITQLRGLANPENVAGMARFGISSANTLGISVATLRQIAKDHRRDHDLALQLWQSGTHEARILATLVDDPKQVTEAQMESWVADIDSWDICDGVCANLFEKTTFAYRKVEEWCIRDEEFVKRAGFVLIARIASADKKALDDRIEPFFAFIEAGAFDERNFVRKAVNWALRQIGKRNLALNAKAITIAERIATLDSISARWIAADALRELRKPAIQQRLHAKQPAR